MNTTPIIQYLITLEVGDTVEVEMLGELITAKLAELEDEIPLEKISIQPY